MKTSYFAVRYRGTTELRTTFRKFNNPKDACIDTFGDYSPNKMIWVPFNKKWIDLNLFEKNQIKNKLNGLDQTT